MTYKAWFSLSGLFFALAFVASTFNGPVIQQPVAQFQPPPPVREEPYSIEVHPQDSKVGIPAEAAPPNPVTVPHDEPPPVVPPVVRPNGNFEIHELGKDAWQIDIPTLNEWYNTNVSVNAGDTYAITAPSNFYGTYQVGLGAALFEVSPSGNRVWSAVAQVFGDIKLRLRLATLDGTAMTFVVKRITAPPAAPVTSPKPDTQAPPPVSTVPWGGVATRNDRPSGVAQPTPSHVPATTSNNTKADDVMAARLIERQGYVDEFSVVVSKINLVKRDLKVRQLSKDEKRELQAELKLLEKRKNELEHLFR